MRKALKYLILPFLCAFSFHAGAQAVLIDTAAIPRDRWVHMDGEFVRQLQPRDSILIGDQLEYGFRLENVPDGTVLGFPKLAGVGSVEMVGEDWAETVTAKDGQPGLIDIEASIKIAAFEEGDYKLPPIVIGRISPSGQVDTLYFDPIDIEVKTVPLDTASFKLHDMKSLIEVPYTWEEFLYDLNKFWELVKMWVILGRWFLILSIAGYCLWRLYSKKGNGVSSYVNEPAHIVALRKLDGLRSNAMWVPEKQKTFYSGVTDALREYISRRYGIGALEMTTAELFDQMKVADISAEQLDELHELFVRADFVKFAKYVASDEDNASTVPVAVRFVTQTYQSDLIAQQQQANDDMETKK